MKLRELVYLSLIHGFNNKMCAFVIFVCLIFVNLELLVKYSNIEEHNAKRK